MGNHMMVLVLVLVLVLVPAGGAHHCGVLQAAVGCALRAHVGATRGAARILGRRRTPSEWIQINDYDLNTHNKLSL